MVIENNPLCGFHIRLHSIPKLQFAGVNMPQTERERLTKAHQSAQFLLNDLRDIHAKTECVAVEELMMTAIEQVANTSRMLGRLESQK